MPDDGTELDVGGPVDDVGAAKVELSVIGRFLSQRPINYNAMSLKLSEVWKPVKGVHVKELPEQRFLFQFFHDFDVKRLVEGSPWTFDNSLLVF